MIGLVIDQLELLGSQRLGDDRSVALAQSGLVHIELIRADTSLDDVLTQAPDRRDIDDIAEAGFGVKGENDSGAGLIGVNHALHTDREADLEMVEAEVFTVVDGTR